jgi:O-antigen/teichoic acid export membrane protein
MIKGQMALSGGLYLAVLLGSLAFISEVDWPSSLYWWFAPILMLEYLNQEISRLLIALSQQISASIVLFLRQGSWAIAIVSLFALVPESRNLELVFALWTASGIAAAGLGAWKLSQLEIAGWRLRVDWHWVRRGIAVSLSFLVATLALRGIQTFDRYWLEHLGGVELVAAYVLFIGMAGSLLVFLDAGIFAFTYPQLIRLHQEGARDKARAVVRLAFWQTLVSIVAFGAVSWFLLPHLLHWIGNPLYEREIGLYPWVLAAMAINGIGMIPHYALYARGFDKPIITSHILGLVIFVAVTWGLSRDGWTLAVVIGLNAALFLILFVKSAAYLFLIAADNSHRTSNS